MASPCEILIDTSDPLLARHITELACREAQRIEAKYSRYRQDSVISVINQSAGSQVAIDDETYRLLSFADTCYQLSDGMFDITSGVLGRAWKFDGSDNVPQAQAIKALLSHTGWQRVAVTAQSITLPAGMQLDLGGIGKEYAVDRVAGMLAAQIEGVSVVVNFGGDIQVTCRRQHDKPWFIGIENPLKTEQGETLVKIFQGGLATSGDARRFLLKEGKRYSHILNPKTGYPVENPPRSVTVAADTCTQAGLLSTLAMLQGKDAEAFLAGQGVTHWVYR
nr:FAD:protein FMN transferase [Alteromonas lipolytica]